MPSLSTPGDATPMHMHACMQFEASFAVDTGHLVYGWLDVLPVYQTCTQSIKVIKRYLFYHSLKLWTFVLCECMQHVCSTPPCSMCSMPADLTVKFYHTT